MFFSEGDILEQQRRDREDEERAQASKALREKLLNMRARSRR